MQYKVQGPDGQQHIIEGPEGASDDEVISQAQKLFSQPSQPQQSIEKGLFGQDIKPPTNTQSPEFSENLERSPQYPTQAMTDTTPGDLLMVQGIGQLGIGLAKGGLAAGKALAKSSPSEILEGIGSKVANFKGFIKNLFTKPATDEELGALTKDVQDTLVNARQQVGKKLGEMRGTDQGALDRLSQIADKGVNPEVNPQEAAKQYHDYFNKLPKQNAPVMEEKGLENLPTLGEAKQQLGVKSAEGSYPLTPHPDFVNKLQPGERLTLKSSYPEMPDLEVIHKGPMVKPPSPEFAKEMGYTEEQLKSLSQPAFDLKTEMPKHMGDVAHPVDSTLAKETLESHGYKIPEGSPNTQDELQHLLKMRNNLKDQISKRTMDQQGNIVKAISSEDERAFTAGINKINSRIEQLPGGKAIRNQEAKFSKLAGIYDDLQGKLKNPEEAKQFLKSIFTNPTGKKADYVKKLMSLEEEIGTDVVSKLKDAFESTKGLTYEQLKHPIASLLRAGMPEVGNVARTVANIATPIVKPVAKAAIPLAEGQVLQHKPFNIPEMQSLRDKLYAQ